MTVHRDHGVSSGRVTRLLDRTVSGEKAERGLDRGDFGVGYLGNAVAHEQTQLRCSQVHPGENDAVANGALHWTRRRSASVLGDSHVPM
jgi:hypothetical protein